MGSHRRHALIVGGGVAALEAALALRALAADSVDVTVLAPDRRFAYRALAVAEPFAPQDAVRYELAAIAQERGFALVRDALAAVDPDSRLVFTQDGRRLAYDSLLVATGARPTAAVENAITFRGPHDAGSVARALHLLAFTGGRAIFASPSGAGWTLPVYELALLTEHWARRSRRPIDVEVVVAERAPLAVFGKAGELAVRRALALAGIVLRTGNAPRALRSGRLVCDEGRPRPASVVVALPRLTGPAIDGLPRDRDGFLPVDGHGRVRGVDDCYAAGDATDHAVKQGGLAAQQAETAARAIARDAGAEVTAPERHLVLRGLLLTGAAPIYLRRDGDEPGEATRDEPVWWPPHKVASRYLGPYLAGAGGEIVKSPVELAAG